MEIVYDKNGKPRDRRGRFIRGHHYSPDTEFNTENHSGSNNPMYGKPGTFLGRKHSENTKQKMSEAQKGHPPTKGSFKKGHKVPQEWRDKISEKTNKGKSPINKLLYHRLYEVWSKPILERDNFTCQECGSNKNLQVHHNKETMSEIICKFSSIKTKSEIVNKIIDYHKYNNVSGTTLCISCHRKTDTYGGKNRRKYNNSPGG